MRRDACSYKHNKQTSNYQIVQIDTTLDKVIFYYEVGTYNLWSRRPFLNAMKRKEHALKMHYVLMLIFLPHYKKIKLIVKLIFIQHRWTSLEIHKTKNITKSQTMQISKMQFTRGYINSQKKFGSLFCETIQWKYLIHIDGSSHKAKYMCKTVSTFYIQSAIYCGYINIKLIWNI